MPELSDYELRALKEIEKHKNTLAVKATRSFLPEGARTALQTRGGQIRDKARQVPGFEQAAAKAQIGYLHAARGLGNTLSRGASLTLSEKRIIRSYRRHGIAIHDLADIRELDLKVVEKQGVPKFMDMAYVLTAGAEGAGAGILITGGEVVALFGGGAGGAAGAAAGAGVGGVAGAGAGAAPGVGTVASVMAVDAAAVLAVSTRVVAHTAMYYGYDPNDPAEAVYMMGVLNLGSATTQASKYAAYAELSKLTQQLARSATWATLNKSAITRLANRFAQAFGVRLTKAKLGQLVPIVGIATGAGLNMWLVGQVSEAAYWTYRERFINEKQGITTLYVPPKPTTETAEAPEENIDILELLAREEPEESADDSGVLETKQPAPTNPGGGSAP